MWLNPNVCFDRVRIANSSASAEGPLATRLRLSALLTQADVLPPGFPSRTVLLVRSLNDPLPRSLNLADRSLCLDRSWERATRMILAARAARASRPVDGRILGDPDTVLFEDEAELLACFALACKEGTTAVRWWWRLLLRQGTAHRQADWMPLWCDRAILVPAAVDHLNHWNQAGAVLATVPPLGAKRVLAAIAHAWSLPTLLDLSAAPAIDGTPIRQDQETTSGPAASSIPSRPSDLPSARSYAEPNRNSPVTPSVAAAVARSGLVHFEQRMLLAISLMLMTHPSRMQSTRFATSVVDWCRRPAPTHPTKPTPDGRRRSDRATTPAHRPVPAVSADSARGSDSPSTTRGSENRNQGDSVPAARAASQEDSRQSPLSPGPVSLVTRREAPDSQDSQRVTPKTAIRVTEVSALGSSPCSGLVSAEPALSRIMALPPVALQGNDQTSPGPEGIATKLGGVFYLINVVERFPPTVQADEPASEEVSMTRWEWLDALARGLLGRAGWVDWQDALWPCLAELGGRDLHQPPGTAWPPANPTALLRHWREVDHLEDPIELIPPHSLPGCGLAPVAAAWIAPVLPFIESKLAGALGCRTDELVPTLLEAPARVFVTATHVDVVLPLEAISLPVRRAGLDRDPGWLPAWGRVIQFQFD